MHSRNQKITHTTKKNRNRDLTWFTQPIWATSTKQRYRLSYSSIGDYKIRFLISALPLPHPHISYCLTGLQFIDVEKKLNNKFYSILSQQNRINYLLFKIWCHQISNKQLLLALSMRFFAKLIQKISTRYLEKDESNMLARGESMVLTEGDFNDIGDTLWHVTEHIWGNIEDQYKGVLAEASRASRNFRCRMAWFKRA